MSLSGPGTVREGDAGLQAVTYQLTLSEPLASPASVRVSAVAGTATTPADFLVPGGATRVVSFAAGQTVQPFTVQVVGEVLREVDESFAVRLSSPVNCTLGNAEVTTRITDNDTYTMSIVPPSGPVPEGQQAIVTLKLSSPATRRESILVSTLADTATAGRDFTSLGNRLVTIEPGRDSLQVPVPVLADSLTEPVERFTFLARPMNVSLGPEARATVSIVDAVIGPPPPPPASVRVSVTAFDATAREFPLTPGTPDTGTFRFSRTNTTGPLTVTYTVGGGATAGTDYERLSGQVTFAAGEATADVVVTAIDDTAFESTETVTVTVQLGATYTVGTPANATVNIISDEVSGNIVVVNVETVTAVASEAGRVPGRVRFSRTGTGVGSLEVTYALLGHARNGFDFDDLLRNADLGRAVFRPGEFMVDIDVVPVDDATAEFVEPVIFAIVPQQNIYRIGPAAEASVTIVSDDTATSKPVDPDRFGLDFVFSVPEESLPANTRLMFSDVNTGMFGYFQRMLGDVVEATLPDGTVLADDVEVVVTFTDTPTNPNRPWSQPGFGGAWPADRRPGPRGLPYRVEMEITTRATTGEGLVRDLNTSRDHGKLLELVGRGLGLDRGLMLNREWNGAVGNLLVRRHSWLIDGYSGWAVVRGTRAWRAYSATPAGPTPVVPVDDSAWDLQKTFWWRRDYFRAFKAWDVFVYGWQERRRGELGSGLIFNNPQIGDVSRGLLQDIGYTILYDVKGGRWVP